MDERRASPRYRVDEKGRIVVSEHATIACMIYDRTDEGVRLTVLDTGEVPNPFLLIADGFRPYNVCVVFWRTNKEIGALFVAR